MPRPQLRRQGTVRREREQASCRHDAVFPNNHGPVVKRRIGNKYVSQQLPRHDAVDGNARVDVVVQADFPFKDDQRASPRFGHRIGNRHDFIDKPLQLLGVQHMARLQKPASPDLFQGAPQLRLKDDRQGNQYDRHALLQHPVDDVQIQDPADDRHGTEHQQPLDQGHGPCVANQNEQLIQHKGDKQNIQYVKQAKAADKPLNRYAHVISPLRQQTNHG